MAKIVAERAVMELINNKTHSCARNLPHGQAAGK
jgi:hypothetical protein